jgi:hypothetical protein
LQDGFRRLEDNSEKNNQQGKTYFFRIKGSFRLFYRNMLSQVQPHPYEGTNLSFSGDEIDEGVLLVLSGCPTKFNSSERILA